MPLTAQANPNPFDPHAGFTVTADGGTPPYQFVAPPPPDNPPGVTITPGTNTAHVMVPPHTPSGTQVKIRVLDSSDPPQTTEVSSTVL